MRRTLLLSAALLGFAVTAHAQAPAATPAPATPPAETPVAKPKVPARRPVHHAVLRRRPLAATPADTGEVRPGHEPGVGDSFPASNNASNITGGDTRSVIAPRLPVPTGGENASIPTLLSDANRALGSGQSGRAQEALERAETAMLQRSVSPDAALTPSQQPDVVQVETARRALANRDVAGARRAVAAAMSAGR